MSRRLLGMLTATTVLAVGNVYYCQPLLGEIASAFHQSAASTGRIPMLCQLGYVMGLLFLTPLGDVLEKRRLLVGLLLLSAVALGMAGLAPTFPLFLAACLGLGLTSVLVQVLIPFVAVLSSPQERARNLGTILSAALIGVLVSRTLAGFVAAHLGWRGVFFVGAATMLVMAGCLRLGLPHYASTARLRYPQLLHSVWRLFRELPALRAIALTGALMYASLSAFWASLAFYLQSDTFHMGPGTAGLFGLVGAVGALAANVAGRNAERIGARRIVQGCILLMLAAWAVFAGVGATWAGLIAGVVLLDLGAQAATVSNQTEIYRIHPEAQTRLNTIYKVFYFVGGACGSALSALAWDLGGWRAVCAVGAGFLLLALAWERSRPVPVRA
ncbi:MFS transporter [Aggregicoccus sp. 17bor-14]|nr:MFS transporter [Simulacricoccus sp. 17bor-14]MRI87591.1 MFS transporter [Aggregicoccus sp. 17bor-14]